MKNISTRTKWHLYLAIQQSIEQSINGLCLTQEPDYIATLIKNLPSRLALLLNKYIPTLKFNVGGCFIHQKPLAKFCDSTLSKKSPEIGDLLIVYKETSPTRTYYNALLLQAKKNNNIYHTPISSSDKHQLLLYTKWPMFKYQRAGNLTGHIRSIKPKTITPGAQYLLIDKQKRNHALWEPCTFWCAKADNILVASNSLAHQIVDFINFQTGCPFVPRGKGIDHWSQMIWDLLTIATNSCFNRKNANFDKSPRFSGDPFDLLTKETIYNQSSNDSIGVSVLAIEGIHQDQKDWHDDKE